MKSKSKKSKKKIENEFLTPTKDEQMLLVLKGECPHNKGYSYLNGYADEIVYTCKKCGAWKTI